ncbi:hypothetical protein [Botryobacter ruber]|uniref:hypothetical protein n=1 Tax=Botryobacter ruber TaxID=2171629 RepID=UPI000E0C5506|nr:hypothetical protein [Botryobacter ruber]
MKRKKFTSQQIAKILKELRMAKESHLLTRCPKLLSRQKTGLRLQAMLLSQNMASLRDAPLTGIKDN